MRANSRLLGPFSQTSFLIIALAIGAGVPCLAGCAAADDPDGAPNYGSLTPFAGAGGSGSPGSGGSGASLGGAAGAGSGAAPQGNGGNAGNAGAGQAGTNANGGQSNANGGTAGATNGGSAGNPPVGGDAGRLGAEACPQGPFPDPLPNGVNGSVQKLVSVGANDFFNWEGVVWTGNELFFSEVGNGNVSQISRYTESGGLTRGVLNDTGSNGMGLDADGDLLLGDHKVGTISEVDLPGLTLTPGAPRRNGQRFNSPNDLVLRGDGNLYFTDPSFQAPQGQLPQGGTRVYRIAPPLASGEITVVDETINNPNGITLSPDGNTLYVAGGSLLRRYTLNAEGEATPAGDMAQDLSVADGMTVDCAGNVYVVENAGRRVRVYSPEGQELGRIGANPSDPEDPFDDMGLTNVAFGGADRRTLFISSASQQDRGGLYSVELEVPGLPY